MAVCDVAPRYVAPLNLVASRYVAVCDVAVCYVAPQSRRKAANLV